VRSIVSCITYALFCPANSSHILYARHNSTPQALEGTNTTLAVKMKLLLLCCWLCQIVNLLAAFNLRVYWVQVVKVLVMVLVVLVCGRGCII
jgi:hypothetical protein